MTESRRASFKPPIITADEDGEEEDEQEEKDSLFSEPEERK